VNDAHYVDYGDGIGFRPRAFGGHCMYVRRTLTDAGPIELPESTADQSVWVEILAVGPKFGTRCSKVHARKWRNMIIEKCKRAGCCEETAMSMARQVPADEPPERMVGQLAFVPLPWPLVDERVMQSPLSNKEFFIEETLPEALTCAPTAQG